MWGVDDWTAAERTERFAEYLELVDRLTRDAVVDYEGRWYATQGAVMEPGFAQQPRPPFMIAAHGARSLDAAARHADTWNTFGPTLADARKGSERLTAACIRIGRDPGEIRRSVLMGLVEGSAWTSADEFAEHVRRWNDAGFTHFIFYDPPYARAGVPRAEPSVVDELLEHTIPQLRRDLAERQR
jgi:alkanesulfonate monooxygenase SsuD/methylene tetrahydromethanopterin reductase-like flavin-dependent oxidoreductase (luciferase family)